MVAVTKIVGKATEAFTKSVKGKIKIPFQTENELISFKRGKELLRANGNKEVVYQIKPEIDMPINPLTMNATKPAVRISKSTFEKADGVAKRELGTVSVRLARTYKMAEESARAEIQSIFKGYDVSVRTKGANSIYSKLEKNVLKKGKVIRTDTGASKMIGDAIGGRVTMPNLTQKDVELVIKNIKIDGKTLSADEQKIMQRFFRNEKLSPAELETAQKYSRQIKLALAERQSEPVVRMVELSALKQALNEGTVTIEQLEKNTFIDKSLIKELKTNPDITPLKITEFNNYRGANGIPYYTDAQIARLKDLQLVTGNHFDIITAPEASRFKNVLTKFEEDALKKSGYTTSQFNAVLSDGSLAEIQIRGKGPFGEVEHIAYDSRQAKNTLGSVYDEYKQAVIAVEKQGLTTEYNNYLSRTYDYYRDVELGIVSTKPTLPESLRAFKGKDGTALLDESNMIELHSRDVAMQAEAKKTFVPHLRYSA